MKSQTVTVIGGGLAGSEAAWQAAEMGVPVRLFEMKPHRFSPAHQSHLLAELVCSNSFRSNVPTSAVGLLKEELRELGSLILKIADAARVPAGRALSVDREEFSREITRTLESRREIEIIRREVGEIVEGEVTVIATGPLTSEPMLEALRALAEPPNLYFYDAIAPIVYADSVDYSKVFKASRYEEGEGDYINCPLTEAQYRAFLEALLAAEQVPLHDFEDPRFFEGCLPIEVPASRGVMTLAFGPMKPVGLIDPRTGQRPYAVVQLRPENREGSLFNMVGFQTKLKQGEQERVFRMIPGLENARFARLGGVHRNTFVHGPKCLTNTLQLKNFGNVLLAGQITGVEGYVESTAMGLLAGVNAARLHLGRPLVVPPAETAIGALVGHVSGSSSSHFQPMNVNFGLFPPLGRRTPKKERGSAYRERALRSLEDWKRSAL